MTRSLDVCIVTADIVGPIRNGGIGTAYYNLAHALARAGHRVTVLYALGTYSENGTIAHWVRTYKRAGITLAPMPTTKIDGHSAVRIAHGVYEWLKTRHFDIVHCHEWRGIGFYAALGKRQGLCLQNSVLCIGTHSPVLWCLEGMNELADAEALEVDFMERQSVALADVLWTPSQHMLDWMARQGWAVPEKVLHLPYIALGLDASKGHPARKGSHLVFFGRLETRKGLDLFCDALDRLVKRGLPPPRVTFLGKQSKVNGVPSGEYIRMRSVRWPFPWRIESSFERDAAMDFLKAPNRVAVLPSKLDNYPYTVLECLASGIPFVASAIGGIPEMMAEHDKARVLFELTAEALANRLADVLAHGLAPAAPLVPLKKTERDWLDWHQRVAPPLSAKKRPRRSAPRAIARKDAPLVTVCMTTRNRPSFAAAALASIRAQDYKRIEVVLVDDGSDQPEAIAYLDTLEPEFRRRSWRIIRQPNRYVGAARNAAIAVARGEYFLFMDDDNLAVPTEVSTFVRAALATGADILTCLMLTFQSTRPTPVRAPDRIWPFLGGALTSGLLRNVFGDANGFFRRSVFERIGGYSEDFGVGAEDWELYARAVLRGLTLHVVPEPLVWYRQSSQGMLNTTSQHANQMRALRPYLELLPAHLRPLLHLSKTGPTTSQPEWTPPAPRLDHVQRAVVFGTGEAGRMALGLADKCGWTVPWLVDNNPTVWNTRMHGKPVRRPDSLASGDPVDLVIVASLAGKPAISKQLEKMGLSAGEHFVHFLDAVRVGRTTFQLSL